MPYNVLPRTIWAGSPGGRRCPGTNPPGRRPPAGGGPCAATRATKAIVNPASAAAIQPCLTRIFSPEGSELRIVRLFGTVRRNAARWGRRFRLPFQMPQSMVAHRVRSGAYQFWGFWSVTRHGGADPLGKASAAGKCRHKRLPPWSAAGPLAGFSLGLRHCASSATGPDPHSPKLNGPPIASWTYSFTPKITDQICAPQLCSRRFSWATIQ